MDVPEPLAALPNWVLWSADKIPLQLNGKPAKSNDPTTWSSLADVLNVADQFGDRIGFMFRAEDGLVGIDLDGAVCEGAIAPWALAIVQEFNCYAEFSPSGQGIHIICQGSLPDARGRKTKLNEPATSDKQPGIEIYSHGRYFTFTGDAIGGEVSPAQDALNRLLGQYWPVETMVRHQAQEVVRPTTKTEVTLDERISRYMQRIEPAISGQGGHSRTLWAARCLVTGFQLSADVAMSYLSQWNLSCLPPWSEKELTHKINQAVSTPCDKPSGWLLVELEPAHQSNVDISALCALKVVAPEPVKQKPFTSVFPADCLQVPGLIGDIMAHTLATAYDPQPELALSGALAMMALLCGQKVTDNRKTRPNIYVIGVEKTSAGKDAARLTNKAILTGIGREELTEDNIGSDSGLTKYIADVPNCLLQIDEIHHMLVSMRNVQNQPHMVAVGRELLTLFPASQTFYKTKLLASTKRTTIRYPNVVLYGTCTVNGFWENITRELIEGGLLGRCMVFEGRGYVDSQEPSQSEVPESILIRARGWLDLKTHSGNMAGTAGQAHTPLLVNHTEEAWERTAEHRKAINKKVLAGEDDFRAAIWKRTAERTNKLALLLACSRSGISYSPAISIEDANLAIKISNWLTNKMLLQVGLYLADTEFDRRVQAFIRFVEQRGECNGSALSNHPSPLKGLTPRERADVIEIAQDGGNVFVEKTPTAGRPLLKYFSATKWSQKMRESEKARKPPLIRPPDPFYEFFCVKNS